MRRLIIATRGSLLARVQAGLVAEQLNKLGYETEFRYVSTKGDKDQTSPLQKIGGDGLFVRGVEQLLLSGEADIAVHSAKDLPYKLMEGLVIGGMPDEADPRDCLVYRDMEGEHPIIGTSSPRRAQVARQFWPDAETESIRGNVPTRIQKLRDGLYDGIILACAGLDRLNADLSGLQQKVFSVEEMTPAPCQGIIAVECRDEDREIREALAAITDPQTRRRFEAERYLFCQLEADCSAAIAVHAQLAGEQIHITASFGERVETRTGAADHYRKLCDEIVDKIYRNK